MPFPDDARLQTFSDGDALPAAVVNAMQDGTIAKRSKTYSRRIPACAGKGAGDFEDSRYYTETASETLLVPIVVEIGERLASVDAKVIEIEPVGDNTITMEILREGAPLGSASSAGGGVDETISVTLDEDVVAGGGAYLAKITFSGSLPWAVYHIEAHFEPQP